MQRSSHKAQSGFTLIEMSIVLIIIGLIIGGILVGKSIKDAAAVRGQIAQIDKYNTAVHAFELKYNYLPGDIPDPYASNFGFMPRGSYDGEGDGNGALRGNCADTSSGAYNHNLYVGCGELAVFWVDLSEASLIDANIKGHDTMGGTAYPQINAAPNPAVTTTSTPAIKDWLPTAKLKGNFIYVYSIDHINYFALSSVTQIGTGGKLQSVGNPGLTVQQAYMIDSKIDDGLPQSGTITACYINNNVLDSVFVWAAGKLFQGIGGAATESGSNGCIPSTFATPSTLTTNCFDNNNVTGVQTYSLSKNATTENCALSFQFQ